MQLIKVFPAAGPEDANVTFLARCYLDRSGAKDIVKQADVVAAAWKVFDGVTLIGSGSLTVANVIFDTLQTGTIWDADPIGYNFKAKLLAASFPTGERTYRVQFLLTLTGADADICPILFDYQTADLLGQ